MGGAAARLTFADAPPTVYLLVGLQGSGKTTHAAKLALRLKEQGRRTLLVAADVYRPAAIDQLKTLGKQIDLPVFDEGQGDPVAIARDGVAEARRLGISDGHHRHRRAAADRRPAHGRARADQGGGEADRDPVRRRRDDRARKPSTSRKTFNDRLGITGVILTKMDGDARGGAALSIHRMTGAPIKFVGVGEKVTALEPFHPDRLGVAHPRDGRRPHADREDAERLLRAAGRRSRQEAAHARSSRSTISSSSCARSARWAR